MDATGVAVKNGGCVEQNIIRQRMYVAGQANIVLREAMAAMALAMPLAACGANVGVAPPAVDTPATADEMLRLNPHPLPDG
jgi:hypothetical protein